MSVILDYLLQKSTLVVKHSLQPCTIYFAKAMPIICWYYLGNMLFYYNEYNSKVARNLTSLMHALSVIFFYTTNIDVYFLYLVSQGYYAIDTAYEIVDLRRAKAIRLYQVGILAHHFVTLYGLQYLINPLTTHYIYDTFFLAELSNLPLYLMRHLMSKGYYNKYLIKGVTFLEFIAYLGLRILLCVPIIYSVFTDPNVDMLLKAMTGAMYFISGFWTYKMFGQLIK
jgi:hypothetical protein